MTMTTELKERSRKLISALEKLGLTIQGGAVDKDKRGDIAVQLGLSEKTVLNYLSDWRKAGYMSSTKTTGKGRPVEFKFLYDLDVIRKKASVTLDVIHMGKVKRLEFQKEAESFLDSLRKKISYGREWTEQKVRDMLKSDLSLPWLSAFRRETDDESSLVQEKKKHTFPISPISKVKGLNSEKKPISKTLTIQEMLVLLRSTWQKGAYTELDDLIVKTKGCSREEAEHLREKWLDEGLIGYDPEGWLIWAR